MENGLKLSESCKKMINFLIGTACGALLITILLYFFPQNIRAVNEELVKNGMAHYDTKTKECIWHIDKTISYNNKGTTDD